MTVLLDDQPLSTEDLKPDATVAQLLDLAKARLKGSGSVIVALRKDHQDVPPESLEDMLTQPLQGFQQLELISGRPKQVVLEALDEVRCSFTDTFATLREICEALTAGRLTEAMEMLSRCVGIWGRTHQAVVEGGALVGVDFERLEVAGRPIVDLLNELAGRLHELKNAVESRDNVLLGDILRYELDETLQQWELMLTAFTAHVESLDD
jgi:hypothetical protein